MSIESFLKENQPGMQFRDFIERKALQESHPTTRICELAGLYREEGSEQIKALSKILSPGEGSVSTIPDERLVMRRFNPEQFLSWGRNGLAVFFGCAIPTIESTRQEGWLDMSEFWGLYDFARAGTFLPKCPDRQIDKCILTPQQWGGLDQAIRNNLTYGIFLEEKGLALLPPSLTTVLRQAYQAYNPVIQEFQAKHNTLARCLTN